MASETHLHQLRRLRQSESSPTDARRRRSPVFCTWPSHRDDIYLHDDDELTLTLSSLVILFFPWIIGPRICVLADPITCVCVYVLFFFPFRVYLDLYSGGPLKPLKGEGLKWVRLPLTHLRPTRRFSSPPAPLLPWHSPSSPPSHSPTPHLVNLGGNSLETPNVWVLSSFHPNVSKQPPPPQCLGFVLFSPRRFYRAELAATWMPRQQLTRRGSHVASRSAQGKTKKAPLPSRKKSRRGERIADGSGCERERLLPMSPAVCRG